MEFEATVNARRSVRDYRPDPVDRQVLERVLHAATLAPSSFNMQPWRFHVTTGETRDRVGAILAQATVHLSEYVGLLGADNLDQAREWFSSLGNAPCVICVSVPSGAEGLEYMNTLLSVGAAVENLMLAAADEGLGTCMVTFAWWVRDELGELLGLDAHHQVAGIISLGYSAETQDRPSARRHDLIDWLD